MAVTSAEDVPLDLSAIEKVLIAETPEDSDYPEYLYHLATQILHNLEFQHRWTSLKLHTKAPKTGKPLPQPLISGLPPNRLYTHPDEQVELLKAESARKQNSSGNHEPSSLEKPVIEWVLPSHLKEKWTLSRFAHVFDSLESRSMKGAKWVESKRVVLATVQDDSTIVYYIMHDGIVKPRQN